MMRGAPASALAVAVILSAAASPSAQSGRFVGTWVSASDDVLNVTTLHADGTFRTEQLQGLQVAGTIQGRWVVRGNAVVWTYIAPKIDKDDINPIVVEHADRFTLREMDGSESSFYRKGVVDPLSPELLPVAVGTGWLFEDADGEQVAIRVSVRERVVNQDAYRVEWIEGAHVYQQEFWVVREDGVHVIARVVLGRRVNFRQPYMLLRRSPVTGDKWDVALTVDDRPMGPSSISVGAPQRVETPAGTFDAVPVTLVSPAVTYRRWYAKGVGLVRDDSIIDAATAPLASKKLKRRL